MNHCAGLRSDQGKLLLFWNFCIWRLSNFIPSVTWSKCFLTKWRIMKLWWSRKLTSKYKKFISIVGWLYNNYHRTKFPLYMRNESFSAVQKQESQRPLTGYKMPASSCSFQRTYLELKKSLQCVNHYAIMRLYVCITIFLLEYDNSHLFIDAIFGSQVWKNLM